MKQPFYDKIIFSDSVMKTNRLFVCQYRDKNLSSKRTVKMHITSKHNADPDNPQMYHVKLVSPGDVNKLLNRVNTATEKVTGTATEKVTDTATEKVTGPEAEKVTGPETEKVTGPEAEKVTDPETEEIGEQEADQVTDKDKGIHNLINHGIIVEAEPTRSKLSNQFSKPDLGQDLVRRSSTKPQTVVTHQAPLSVHITDPVLSSISSHQGSINSQDHRGEETTYLPPPQPPNVTSQISPLPISNEGQVSPPHLNGEGLVLLPDQVLPPHLPGEGQLLSGHLTSAGECQVSEVHQTLAPQQASEGSDLPLPVLGGGQYLQPSDGQMIVSQITSDGQVILHCVDGPGQFLPPQGYHFYPLNVSSLSPQPPPPYYQTTSDGDPPCEQPMSGSSTRYDQSAHQSLQSTLQLQKRSAFTVPYSKRPRGKCTDWLNCENCSLDVDCGECRNCLDKSLQ